MPKPLRRNLRAALLASVMVVPMVLPIVAAGQPATSSPAQSGTADAIRVLFDQATFWRNQYQPEKADEALSRVLTLDPNNADALAMQAQSAADAGNTEAANNALRRLRAVRPDDPRIASVEQLLHVGPPNPQGIEEGRRLSREDKPTEAVEAFRRAFHGSTPPAAYATEYYLTLAAADGGWEPAREGLATAIRANPEDLRMQLAYAELLTYRDETRDEGLDRLSKLMGYPSIARQADLSYRKALFWLPNNPASVAHYDIYMDLHPGDSEIANRETQAKNDLNSIRLDGYAALQAGHLDEAQTQFTKALAANSDDSDALLGMALVRFQQKREDEGRTLIRRVIEIDPTKREEFEKFLVAPSAQVASNGDAGARPDPRAAARSRAQYQRVVSLTNAGDYAGAEAALRRAAGGRMNAGNYLQLADIQMRAGRSADAGVSYRRVLAQQPRNALALAGLGRLAAQSGRFAEAEKLFARAGGQANTAEISRLRGEAYRLQASTATDPAQRLALLRQATAVDPRDPWIRLELARLLAAQGRDGEANAIMAAVTASPQASPQQLLAGIYYANENKDLRQAGVLASRLPEANRDDLVRDIQSRSAIQAEIQDAQTRGTPDEVRDRIFELAARPDPTGARADALASYLTRRGDKGGAREVVRLALAGMTPTPQQRIAYAGALVGANYPGDAKRVTAKLAGERLTPLQTTRLAGVNDMIAVSSADQLNRRGRSNAALEELQPRLEENPDSTDLNMALVRAYEGKRQSRRALALGEDLLKKNPGSLDVRQTTLSAAVAAGDLTRAAQLADETRTMFPDAPQSWIMSAESLRAHGQNTRALEDLRTARTLRQEQLKANQSSSVETSSVRDGDRHAAAAERASWQRYADAGRSMNDVSGLPIEADEAVTREYVLDSAPAAPAPVRVAQLSAGQIRVAQVPLSAPPSTFTDRAFPPAQPGVTSEYQAPETPRFDNVFRATPALVPDEPIGTPNLLGSQPLARPTSRPVDPLLGEIDRNILQVSSEVVPHADASLSLRGRSGAPGLERLFEVASPMEASFSPGGVGRVKVQVTPTALYSGRISSQDLPRYATNPLVPYGKTPLDVRNQATRGIGLDVGYVYRYLSGDVGVTPLGFAQRNVVGGIEIAPHIAPDLVLRVVADRRAVTDSMLSYAGQTDYRTGQHWGGVTRNRGHAQVEGNIEGVSYYAGGGGGVLVGRDVAQNSEFDGGAGFSLPVYTDERQQVRVGTDLVYFGFQKNLSGFTLGNGGYFSPQQFFAALPSVNYRNQVTDDLVFNVGGSVGFQTFRTKSSDLFPNDPVLQAQLAKLALAEPGLTQKTGGARKSGLTGGAHGDVDYRVTDNLHVGAQIGFDRSGPFTEGTGLVYARYILNDPQPPQ